jgi:hypothetical protein
MVLETWILGRNKKGVMMKREEVTALVARELWELSDYQADNDLKNWEDAQKIISMLLDSGVTHMANADCRHRMIIGSLSREEKEDRWRTEHTGWTNYDLTKGTKQ